MKEYLKEYCVGCGLCEALDKAKCETDEKGFLHPISGDESWLERVCPSGGRQCDVMGKSNIWGRYKSVYYGWSSDSETRKLASSGGVLTEIAAWAVECGYADAVLHTCADPNSPTKTICCESRTRKELISRCGSRYSISHPLSALNSIDRNKKYVFIGKPCDITALYNFLEEDPSYKENIVLTLSFFCAGLPSMAAQRKLVEYLGCSMDTVSTLRYRGDGWPGYTTAIDKQGNVYRTDYETSWGTMLGRDIMKMCRFCMDGIAELADISCGDAWYVGTNNKPKFDEHEGRNVIFSRSEKGNEMLNKIIKDGRITVESPKLDELRFIQKYQYDRKSTMLDKILALKIAGRPVPRYSFQNMKYYGEGVPLKRHLSIFGGILKRIRQGKI